MTNKTKARVDAMIEKYDLFVSRDKVGTYSNSIMHDPNGAWDFLKENKAYFLQRIPEQKAEIKAEREAEKAAAVTFYVCGWKGHQVSVDTRKDIEAQLRRIAEYYENYGITYDIAKEAYQEQLKKITVYEGKKAEEEARVEVLKKTAKETGEPQKIKTYESDCNDPREECSMDIVTIWAMPDGTIKKERQHTW